MQAGQRVDLSIQVPDLASEEMKVLQMVLETLSLYWQPLRKLVCLDLSSDPEAISFQASTSRAIPKTNQYRQSSLPRSSSVINPTTQI
jgi:hypothetical protein